MESRFEISSASVAEIRRSIEAKVISYDEALSTAFDRMGQLDKEGPKLNALLSLVEVDEVHLQQERSKPLSGIAFLAKDNIDTQDLPTTAGSLAFEGLPASSDAPIITLMRSLGATLIGKTNLSEWSNFRGIYSASGWSGVGGQTRNPHRLDRSPGGSSSGSAVAVAAGYVPIALGTETDGSIICPASVNGVVGFKPTHGILPTEGVVPISRTQDTLGIFARSVLDVEIVYSALIDKLGKGALFGEGSASTNLSARPQPTPFRIGVPRAGFFGYSPKSDLVFEDVLIALGEAGILVIDDIATRAGSDLSFNIGHELLVLRWEMKQELGKYLSARGVEGRSSLEEIVDFNRDNSSREMSFFGQEHFLAACEMDDSYRSDYEVARSTNLGHTRGEIRKTLINGDVDFLLVPSMGPAWLIDHICGDVIAGSGYSLAAIAGLPSINIPIGDVFGLPVGMTLFGDAYSDLHLLRVASRIQEILSLKLLPGFSTSSGL
ncbi:amidase family protein [Acidithrix ferrooxidans]|uniref:Glutamyl-tRNA(Gln) amidotransferase subunit A n=1 Tax=Acidithrix ferrooxidans TaxID=1280514 RepID=A0A0D8HMG7_9ACTN|nr:amidase family protein [Acidithrix ferrooxidans]KJF18286.1 glutamyl-tRNA(Gln) amidotransferase subunit A [Acidithrix ferrooxidans]